LPKQIKIFSDGGARGNPGPAAIAFLILSEAGQTLIEKSHYLGHRTNNQAEYEALIAALESAVVFGAEEVTCHLDSQLVVKQVNGKYRVRNVELMKLWRKVQELLKSFKKVNFISVRRTNIQIQRADILLNKTLDEQF
jgi:ribonuclease HI